VNCFSPLTPAIPALLATAALRVVPAPIVTTTSSIHVGAPTFSGRAQQFKSAPPRPGRSRRQAAPTRALNRLSPLSPTIPAPLATAALRVVPTTIFTTTLSIHVGAPTILFRERTTARQQFLDCRAMLSSNRALLTVDCELPFSLFSDLLLATRHQPLATDSNHSSLSSATLLFSTLAQSPLPTPLQSTHAHLPHSRPPITPAIPTHANLVSLNPFPRNTSAKNTCGRRADILGHDVSSPTGGKKPENRPEGRPLHKKEAGDQCGRGEVEWGPERFMRNIRGIMARQSMPRIQYTSTKASMDAWRCTSPYSMPCA